VTPNGIVTLLTDFGTDDVFVGAMKGVILSIAPDARIVDISHAVPAQNVRLGSLFLGASAPYFPRGTAHVAVVDPGVGSHRRAIAVETENAWFVAPDNGLLTDALRDATIVHTVELTESRYWLPAPSATFHGRDIFAPVAAHLVRGLSVRRLGRPAADVVWLPERPPIREGNTLRVEVLFADRFGNLITNLRRADVEAEITSVRLAGREVGPPRSSYSAGEPGEWLAVWNSFGLLELAVGGGSLAQELDWEPSEERIVTVAVR
jgi:S-adenosylmethionine hydrolase